MVEGPRPPQALPPRQEPEVRRRVFTLLDQDDIKTLRSGLVIAVALLCVAATAGLAWRVFAWAAGLGG